MALNKTLVSIPLTGGMDSKTSEKLLPSGSFINLINTVRRQKGILEKRYGFSSLGTSAAIVEGKKLETFNDDLLLINNSGLYSYLTSTRSWVSRGDLTTVSIVSSPVVRNSDVQAMPSCDYLNGFEVYAWEDSRGGIRCSVVDSTNGAFYQSDVSVTSTGSRPKVVAFNGVVAIMYYEPTGSTLKVRRIVASDPTTLQAAQTVESGSMTDNPWDVAAFNNYAVFAYNTSTTVRVGYMSISGTVGTAATGSGDPIETATRGRSAVAVVPDTAHDQIYVFYHDSAGASTNNLLADTFSSALVRLKTEVAEPIEVGVRNITGVCDPTHVRLFYELSGSTADVHHVRTKQYSYISGTTTSTSTVILKRSVGLVAKAFYNGSTACVGVAHESTLQSTYFILATSGTIIGKLQASKGAGLTRDTSGTLKSGLCRIATSATGEYFTALTVKNRLEAVDTTVQSAYIGVIRAKLSFNDSTYNSETLGKNLHVAGGVVLDYDGSNVVEHGFNLYPERVVLAATNGGSLTSSQTYYVKLVYEWIDAQGQTHESAASVAQSVALGGSDTAITVTAPTLRLTRKNRVKVVAYRSQAGDPINFYRDNEIVNDPTADTVTITLTRADTSLVTKQILYTVGGALDNIAPPASKVVHAHKNRVWLAGTEDDNVWYSKFYTDTEAVNFNDGFIVPFKKVTAISSIDNNLIIFRSNSIHLLNGEGPLDSGAQSDYGEPQLITSDVGCVEPKSIAITADGIIFKANSGIYSLSRGLQLKYIGDKMEKYNAATITSATVFSDINEVRLTTSDNVALIYNTYFNEWSVFDNYTAVSACLWKNTYCHLKSTGIVNQEVADQYHDNGLRIKMTIETNWLQFNKIQGYQRLYRWALLGDFIEHCGCKVDLAYNFEPVYNETVYFYSQAGLGTAVYGDDTYGETAVYGGSDSQVFQFRSKPRIQKCESFKLRISDVDNISANGSACFKLASMAFEIGGKEGMFKMPSNKTRGV